MANDPVDAVLTAFLNHLENGGPEPSLDHLTPEDRAEAEDLIEIIRSGRGIDAYRSRPSLHTLLADTEFEEWLSPPETIGLSIDAIRADVVSALGVGAELIMDGAATNEGINSDVVIVWRGVRLCVQFRDDLSTPTALAQVDPRAAAGPIYGRFPGRVGVILLIGNGELSSVPIGPHDIDDYVGAPDGQVHPPRIMRPVLPLVDTLRSYIDEVAPDLSMAADYIAPDTIDAPGIIDMSAIGACGAVVAEGKKSRTEAKKDTWTEFDDSAGLVAAITTAIWNGGLSPEGLRERLDAAAPAA
jgi:hypothetical protein